MVSVRHDKFPRNERKPANPRRIASTKRTLKRQRDKLPLFADQVAAEQPSPEERIEKHEDFHAVYWQNLRDHEAKAWREGRKLLVEKPPEEQELLRFIWQVSNIPGSGAYLCGFVKTYLAKTTARLAAGERWFVFCVGDRTFPLMWQADKAPSTAIAGPFEDFRSVIEILSRKESPDGKNT
jgi:hypothetical protein